jgi:hypothetical protein
MHIVVPYYNTSTSAQKKEIKKRATTNSKQPHCTANPRMTKDIIDPVLQDLGAYTVVSSSLAASSKVECHMGPRATSQRTSLRRNDRRRVGPPAAKPHRPSQQRKSAGHTSGLLANFVGATSTRSLPDRCPPPSRCQALQSLRQRPLPSHLSTPWTLYPKTSTRSPPCWQPPIAKHELPKRHLQRGERRHSVAVA